MNHPLAGLRRAVCLLAALSAAGAEVTLTVSPHGPLRTLEQARDAVRARKAKGETGPFRVQLRAGTYRLDRPLLLTTQDSGVTYESYPNERAIISGGREVKGWRKGGGPLWTAPVDPAHDLRQLFINGRRAQRARTPNHGFFRILGPSSEDKLFQLPYRGMPLLKTWAGQGVEVVALLGWTAFRRPILTVDPDREVATLAGNSGGSAVGNVKDDDGRYYFENAREALDSPGEWYFDRAAGQLHYWPLGIENLAAEPTVVDALPHLIRFDGPIEHVTLRGLDFRHAAWTLPADGYADAPQAAVGVGAAIELNHATDCVIEDSTFTQNGGYAIWAARGARRNQFVRNRIYDMGAGGIKIGEAILRSAADDQTSANVLTDNTLHDLGLVYPEAVGIWVGHSGHNLIAHNRIHDVIYSGISVGWTWGYAPNPCQGNRIEFNHVFRIGKDTLNDLGGIYLLGAHNGTTVRNNLVHDVTSFADRGRAIYLDEGSTGVLVENNIVHHNKSSAFHLHYGKDNVIRNNIFALNRDAQYSRGRAEEFFAFTIERNIIYFDRGRSLGGAWNDDPHFAVRQNLYFDTRGGDLRQGKRSWVEWTQAGHDQRSVIADPLFLDPERGDFRLRPNSPAARIGFQPIDVSSVGPRPTPASTVRPASTPAR